MSAEETMRRVRGMAASKWTFRLLVAVYAGIVLTIMAPVLFTSVSADDSYWILQAAPENHGSFWQAFWTPLSHAFDFDGQPRSTSLATSERQVVALAAMEFGMHFAVAPYLVWAAIKVGLLGLSLVAVVAFLRELRYRSREGTITKVRTASIAFIAICLPLTVAIGAKAQSLGTLNGWLNYPTITYAPFALYLLIAALSLRVSRLLNRSYRTWVVPAVLVLAFIALMINLDYEFVALSIPLSVFVLILQPLPERNTFWARWRGKLTVLLALAGTYTVIFVWIRWRISQMACQTAGTCYSGTEIGISPKTLSYNLIGAFPGGTGAFTSTEATRIGRPQPTADSFSIVLAILGALVLVALLVSWHVRHSQSSESYFTNRRRLEPSEARQEIRGLLIVCAFAVVMALGSATITGISARAVEQVQSTMIPYRNGVVTWSAIALFALAAVRLVSLAPWRAARFGVMVVFLAVLVASVSLYMPRNIESGQANRLSTGVQLIDSLHWGVALGDLSTKADAARCDAIAQFESHQKALSSRFVQSVKGAYDSFEFYYERPYCSTGAGLGE